MFETNEAGEIILVESKVDTPAKKTRKQKKEKEPTFLPSFFSEEYFNFLIGDHGLGAGDATTYTPHLLLKWKNEEYLPLYSLKIRIPNNIPYYEYRMLQAHGATNPAIWDQIRIGKLLKERMPQFGLPYVKKLWETKNFRLLSFLNEGMVSPSVEIDFNTRMKELVDRQFNQLLAQGPDVSIQIPAGGFRQGTPRLINKFKYENEWKWTQIKQTGTQYYQSPMYLSNLGFIARQSQWNNSGNINVPIGMYPIKPLVCFVFKKEYFQLIKSYILANEPIPTELLELWVDKSLEDPADLSQPIKASYVRQIRNPYKKLGIEAIIKDSLVDELFHRPEIKKFRTHMEQINWIDNILQEFTIEEKKKLRIS